MRAAAKCSWKDNKSTRYTSIVKTQSMSEVKKEIIKLGLGTGLLTIQYRKVPTFQTLVFSFCSRASFQLQANMTDSRTIHGVNALSICVLLILFNGKSVDKSEGGVAGGRKSFFRFCIYL